jgi:O-acetyl-ADP-ribose deacetylase
MKTSIGRTSLDIVSGDITQLDVDAITCAANAELSMDAGLAAAIKRAGGEAIEKEAMLQGPIEIGQAVATTGQQLKARWVVHAAVMGADGKTDAAAVAKATRAALDCANRAHARSLALPAFGTGVGGFPVYHCASIMVAETVRYLNERKNTGLRRVSFCTYSDPARAAFKDALAGASRF